MKVKKTPLRMCTACREMKDKKSLVRIVKNKEDEVSLDPGGKKPGRGAYICRSPECFKKAVKTRALERALAAKIPEDLFEKISGEVTDAE